MRILMRSAYNPAAALKIQDRKMQNWKMKDLAGAGKWRTMIKWKGLWTIEICLAIGKPFEKQ